MSFLHTILRREYMTRALTVAAVITQGAILDHFLIIYNGSSWAPWIIADCITVLCLFGGFYYSHRYHQRYDQIEQDENRRKLTEDWKHGGKTLRPPAILPGVWFTWLIYSGLLVAKIAVIFKTFGSLLGGEQTWGTNLLEFAIAGTGGVFAFIIAGRKRRPTPSQKVCLKFMQQHVLLEIVDCVEFLTILFTAEHNLLIPNFVFNMILAFTCVNFILPAIGLYQLSGSNFSKEKPRENFYIFQTIMSTVFGNMPFLIIRVFLWTDHQFTNALFVMKNIIAIVQNIAELAHYFSKKYEHEQHGGPLAIAEDLSG